MSVCPHAWNNSAPIFEYCLKICQENEVSLKLDKNNRHFTWIPIHIFYHFLFSSLQNEKCFRPKVQRKSKHILCLVTFFLENCAISAMWKNIVQSEMPQMTIWRTRISWWVPQTTNAHLEYVILSAFLLQHWLHEHASMLCYTYIASFVS
jgi:hypothetical protein